MLAQSFKSAADLGLSEKHRDALIKALALLETGKMVYQRLPDHGRRLWCEEASFCGKFNMQAWAESYDCGTICCIGGAAELIGGVNFDDAININGSLYRLFYPPNLYARPHITVEQAARALRSYLTCGEARWDYLNDLQEW